MTFKLVRPLRTETSLGLRNIHEDSYWQKFNILCIENNNIEKNKIENIKIMIDGKKRYI